MFGCVCDRKSQYFLCWFRTHGNTLTSTFKQNNNAEKLHSSAPSCVAYSVQSEYESQFKKHFLTRNDNESALIHKLTLSKMMFPCYSFCIICLLHSHSIAYGCFGSFWVLLPCCDPCCSNCLFDIRNVKPSSAVGKLNKQWRS